MKRISHTSRSRDKLLHIETDLGIINIRVGLHDAEGREVESIEILPDNYTRETPVVLDGYSNSRLIRGGVEKARIPSDIAGGARDIIEKIEGYRP